MHKTAKRNTGMAFLWRAVKHLQELPCTPARKQICHAKALDFPVKGAQN